MEEIALIAPTASGKTELSISLAKELNANILSLDSLSIYKEIDIASAKPTIKERTNIEHFGIDIVSPNQTFSVVEFIKEYKRAKKLSINSGKNLIIVGGSSFYLKSMIDGVSEYNFNTSLEVTKYLNSITTLEAYNELSIVDLNYAKTLKNSDTYRVKKGLELYKSSGMTPSEIFIKYPVKPIIERLDIYEIDTNRDVLRDRIRQRTNKMINNGLIDEVIYLEKKYSRKPNSMKSIGIKECLQYLDGHISKDELVEKISISTSQLAKRQKTFNKTQFKDVISLPINHLFDKIVKNFKEL